MLTKTLLRLIISLLLLPSVIYAQTTTSSMSGIVKAADGTPLTGATVNATHEPTGTVYRVQTLNEGRFDISNMNPGGPYSVEISYVNYNTEKKSYVNLSLGEVYKLNIVLATRGTVLSEVIVKATANGTEIKGGTGTNIGRDKMANLPTVGRNLTDFLRFTPQAKLTAADGGISIAGQNNRYNAFYIDGAINNDVFGLSNSGTNGGQTGSPPISIDAIDQFQVIISPYDASLGNFTGGGINATTKSGTNKTTGSIYSFYRNQDFVGKTPIGPKDSAKRVSNFRAKTFGFRVGGPIVKNKLFYFLNVEMQRDERPQPFEFSQYVGSSTKADIDAFVGYLKTKYKYDAGSYLDNPDVVNADKVAAKIDWNLNPRNHLSISYRYNNAERLNTSASSTSRINFFNNGYKFPSLTNSLSAEFKSSFKKSSSNRLLLTYTGVTDDRGAIGNPFPRVTITDGSGQFVIGTEPSSTGNLLKQNNIGLIDNYKFNIGKNYFSVGTDNEYSHSNNVFIQNYYGTYTYPTINDFMDGNNPTSYIRGFSRIDENKGDNTEAAAKFNTMRLGAFINDEIRVSENFSINIGVRADYTKFITKPLTDNFFNDTAIAVINKYYDLQGARSGQISSPKVSISPRVGFTLKIPDENVTIRGGAGLFTGRIPLVWPGGVYNQNGVSLGQINVSPSPTLNIPFRSDPFNQYSASDLGVAINSRGEVDLIAKNFKLPKIFRTSLAFEKRYGNGWSTSFEGIFSKNINEIYYQNLNLLPRTIKLTGVDTRTVFATNSSGVPLKLPLRADGSNPYSGDIIFLSNNKGPKGFSYNLTFTIDKAWIHGFAFNANYTFGNSIVANEGTSSTNQSQWNGMESVNGRNYVTLSKSDFDLGHRINAYIAKKISYAHGALATTVSLVYNGQSGNPFSYTYSRASTSPRSLVGESSSSTQYDLLFVPTKDQLDQQVFTTNVVGATVYTPAQQKELLNSYIENDSYLKTRRGLYAERNGARLPFTHIVDLKVQQDFNLKVGGKKYQFQLTYDVFNFTNMLNRDWGRQYFLSFDQFTLVQFNNLRNGTTIPQYKFTPITANNGLPYGLSTVTTPSYSARWVGQIGLRFNF